MATQAAQGFRAGWNLLSFWERFGIYGAISALIAVGLCLFLLRPVPLTAEQMRHVEQMRKAFAQEPVEGAIAVLRNGHYVLLQVVAVQRSNDQIRLTHLGTKSENYMSLEPDDYSLYNIVALIRPTEGSRYEDARAKLLPVKKSK